MSTSGSGSASVARTARQPEMMKGSLMPAKRMPLSFVWILFASVSLAGDIVGPKSLIVFAYSDRPSVSASLRKEADVVAMPISIRSDHKEPPKRFEAIALAKAAIIKAAEGRKGIRVHSGPVALSARPIGKLESFSSSGYGSPSQAQLHVLIPLAGNGKDVFQCAAEIHEFMKGVRLPDKADLEFGQVHLGVENPEQYRGALLKLIADEVGKARKALGAASQPLVGGLESPVSARQADERNVDLFLSYTISLTVRE